MGCHCLLWEDGWGTGAKADTLLLIMKPSSLGREGVGRGKCVIGGAEAFCDTQHLRAGPWVLRDGLLHNEPASS